MATTTTTLYKIICGSHLYGTATLTSDTDIGEVLLESKAQLMGTQHENTLPQLISDEKDVNRHWLRNFARLCLKCNPNVLEWLYAPPSMIQECHPLFEKFILKNRALFLSKHALIKSHFGFANAQISKMEVYAPDRGKARKELIDKYNYDPKYANHALRLIWELEQFLREGELVLPYNEYVQESLIAIKEGKLSKSDFLDLYYRECDRINEAVTKNLAQLPEHPKIDIINELLVEFYEALYYGKEQ